MLKQHNSSQWHKDAVVASQRAASGRTVFGMQLAGVRKAQEEKRLKNRSIILKLLRSVYFMAKEHVSHSTTFTDLVGLQIENGDDTLKQHVESGAENAQYTSSFSCTNMIKAIDDWILNGLHSSIRKSSYFSILAEESQDITSQEELSVCCRWLVDGKPEEHFFGCHSEYVKATNAETLAKALTDFIETTGLDFEKLVGQGYDGAATFSETKTEVGKRIRTRAAHALYVHCSCHRLQLASVQAAASNPEIKKVFGMMTNLWKLFYYSPRKAEALKEVSSVLNLPQLKVVKPSDTRWLSHERCIKAICKDLPSLIITLQQLYESDGDNEAFGVVTLLSSTVGIMSVIMLSHVLSIVTKLNLFMQASNADFTRLPNFLSNIYEELMSAKDEDSVWITKSKEAMTSLREEHGITIADKFGFTSAVISAEQYSDKIAAPYISKLISNIKKRFSDETVSLLVASSVFHPLKLPPIDRVRGYGEEKIGVLASFYGEDAEIEFQSTRFVSKALICKETLLEEWHMFAKALVQEKKKWKKKPLTLQ